MRIAIIGAGSVGATVGLAWIKRGEDVIWGLRNPADPKHVALPKDRDPNTSRGRQRRGGRGDRDALVGSRGGNQKLGKPRW